MAEKTGISTKPRWGQMLLAIALGNLLYYSLMPFLPRPLRHEIFQLDFGMALAFLFCVGIYFALGRWVFRRRV